MKFSYSQERILNEWEVQSLAPIQRGFSLFDGDLAKLNLINKSKILHGLYSYRPYYRNDAKMFKTQVEPRAAGEWFHCKVDSL